MRIGVNLHLLRPDVGGIGNFVRTVLREGSRRMPEHTLVPFTFSHHEDQLADLPPELRQNEVRLPHQDAIRDHLDKFDVFFCPFGALYPRPVPKPSVVLVMDIQERFFPEFFTPRQVRDRLYHYTWSMRMADRVIAISDFARRSFINLASIPSDRIETVHLCADELPEEEQPASFPLSTDEPFVLYPANSWPHKNHRRLFEALYLLRDNGLRLPCILTGTHVEGTTPLADPIRAAGAEDLVHDLGRVSRAGLAWLYRHARLLVNPSLFEGFGIPLVEALQSRLPMACSNTTSLPEVGGAAATYFDPEDVADIAGVIRRAWEDDKLRAELAEKGTLQAEKFTPEKTMRALSRVFDRARAAYSPTRYLRQRIFWQPVSRFWNIRGHVSAGQRAQAQSFLRSG